MIGAPLTRVQIVIMAAALLFVILKVPLYGMRMTFLGLNMSVRRYLLISWAAATTAVLVFGL